MEGGAGWPREPDDELYYNKMLAGSREDRKDV